MAIRYNINKDYIVYYYRNEEQYITLQSNEDINDYCNVLHRDTGENTLCANPNISMIINSSHFMTDEDISEEKEIHIVFNNTEEMNDFEKDLLSEKRFIQFPIDRMQEHLACNINNYV